MCVSGSLRWTYWSVLREFGYQGLVGVTAYKRLAYERKPLIRESLCFPVPMAIHLEQPAYERKPVIRDRFRIPDESLVSGGDCIHSGIQLP